MVKNKYPVTFAQQCKLVNFFEFVNWKEQLKNYL